jgi:hypothetical protein
MLVTFGVGKGLWFYSVALYQVLGVFAFLVHNSLINKILLLQKKKERLLTLIPSLASLHHYILLSSRDQQQNTSKYKMLGLPLPLIYFHHKWHLSLTTRRIEDPNQWNYKRVQSFSILLNLFQSNIFLALSNFIKYL